MKRYKVINDLLLFVNYGFLNKKFKNYRQNKYAFKVQVISTSLNVAYSLQYHRSKRIQGIM